MITIVCKKCEQKIDVKVGELKESYMRVYDTKCHNCGEKNRVILKRKFGVVEVCQ